MNRTAVIELIKWTAKIEMENEIKKKTGASENEGLNNSEISSSVSCIMPFLHQLKIKKKAWFKVVNHFEDFFTSVVGSSSEMSKFALESGQKWFQGISNSRIFFPA